MSESRTAATSDAEGMSRLRALPAVGRVVEGLRQSSQRAQDADAELLAYLCRQRVEGYRQHLLADPKAQAPSLDGAIRECSSDLARWDRESSTQRVINGTGIVLHSGLGRAVLPSDVVDRLAEQRGYVLLEVDQEAGHRRRRDAFVERLLCHLTGAEAAMVVNNNAAATMLLLGGLAKGREVIVSRSQMVEIGGSFRMPDVMEASGCKLREVGTTNRSYGRDYEEAVGKDTGALMLVHTSNYRVVGFTEHVGIEEMVEIGRRVDVPVIHDLGSGCLLEPDAVPFAVRSLFDEPPVRHSVEAGADVICFSGDKLLGGVQSGIIVGKKLWIERLRRDPLARALRIDKLSCVALETALKLYLEPSRLQQSIPTLRMLAMEPDTLRRRAESLRDQLRASLAKASHDTGASGDPATIELTESHSEMGSGALPAVPLPTTCVAVTPQGLSAQGLSATRLARRLRFHSPPCFTRVKDDAVLIDPRTLQEGEDEEIVIALVTQLMGARESA